MMPCQPDRRGRKVRRESLVILEVRRGPRESKAMKVRWARRECRAFKARLAMMARWVPKVRKECKASPVKPGRKESLEILAVQSVLKGQQVPTERTALMEPKVRPER